MIRQTWFNDKIFHRKEASQVLNYKNLLVKNRQLGR